jgi:TRAP-type mannitol/chloroaromatic compound transport system substrate-binding protein
MSKNIPLNINRKEIPMGFKSIYEAFYEDGESELNALLAKKTELEHKLENAKKQLKEAANNRDYKMMQEQSNIKSQCQRELVRLDFEIRKLEDRANIQKQADDFFRVGKDSINNLFRH